MLVLKGVVASCGTWGWGGLREGIIYKGVGRELWRRC